MAVARVGGTKAKIRGQVGDQIFQVKRNSDGTYTQYTYAKGVRTEVTLTPRLQAQRMCMAIVESMMRDLKPIARISFQSAKTKNASLNSFSSFNTQLVLRDCQEHWYGDNKFLFPYRNRTDVTVKDEGGPFMLSSGTLKENVFDYFAEDWQTRYQFIEISPWDQMFYGVVFECQIGVDTLNDFRRKHRMTIYDQIGICAYRHWVDFVTDPDDPIEYLRHEYIIASFNQSIPGNTLMTEEVIKKLFSFETGWTAGVFMGRNFQGFGIGHAVEMSALDEQVYYSGAFSISSYSGKKQISTSFYRNPWGGDEPWLLDEYPAYNFGSWMGDPHNHNYPSPFV